jgi:hypothetical protein
MGIGRKYRNPKREIRKAKSRFIAQKARDGAEILASLGMTIFNIGRGHKEEFR